MTLLVIAFGTNQTRRAAATISNDVLKTIVVGLLMLIVPSIVFALLFATIVGIPLALVLILLWGVVLFLGQVVVGTWIGERHPAARSYGQPPLRCDLPGGAHPDPALVDRRGAAPRRHLRHRCGHARRLAGASRWRQSASASWLRRSVGPADVRRAPALRAPALRSPTATSGRPLASAGWPAAQQLAPGLGSQRTAPSLGHRPDGGASWYVGRSLPVASSVRMTAGDRR